MCSMTSSCEFNRSSAGYRIQISDLDGLIVESYQLGNVERIIISTSYILTVVSTAVVVE